MKRKLISFVFVLSDAIFINIAVALAFLLRFDGRTDMAYIGDLPYIFIITTFIKIICFAFFKLYSSLWRYAGIYEVTAIVGASFISNFILLAGSILFKNDTFRNVFIITFFIDIALIGGFRMAYRIIRRITRIRTIKSINPKRVMLIGGGSAGSLIINELVLHPELKRLPVVIIDDDTGKIGKKINGIPIVGGRNEIVRTVLRKKIDEIIIAIPSAGVGVIDEIYNECLRTHCKIKILPGVSQLIDESLAIKKIRDVDVTDLLGREPINIDTGAIVSYIKNQTVMVTGGGGSIGIELCRQIACFNPIKLIVLDNYENNAYELQNELANCYPELDITITIANIREIERLDSIFKTYRPDLVFHAAAHKHVPLMELNPSEAIRNNILGTMNIVDCSVKYKAKKLILISTDKAVNPVSVMGATKRAAELIIQSEGCQNSTVLAAVRFGNVLGSNGSVVPLFKKQIEKGGPVTVTHPEVTRFFMTIPEAAQLVIEAGAKARGGEIFVLDMGKPVKIYDLARTLIKLSGYEPDEDIKIVFTGMRPGEKMYEELQSAEEQVQFTDNKKIFLIPPPYIDGIKLRKELIHLKYLASRDSEKAVEYLYSIISGYAVNSSGTERRLSGLNG